MATKAEQDTVIRWDRENRTVQLYTADPAQACRWNRLGHDVSVQGSNRDGRPHGWTATGPGGCVRFRRLLRAPAERVEAEFEIGLPDPGQAEGPDGVELDVLDVRPLRVEPPGRRQAHDARQVVHHAVPVRLGRLGRPDHERARGIAREPGVEVAQHLLRQSSVLVCAACATTRMWKCFPGEADFRADGPSSTNPSARIRPPKVRSTSGPSPAPHTRQGPGA